MRIGRGIPAKPLTVLFGLNDSGIVLASSTWTGRRPDWKLQRAGEHDLKASADCVDPRKVQSKRFTLCCGKEGERSSWKRRGAASLTVAAELDPAACQRVDVWSLDLGSRRQPSAGTMIAHISPPEVVHDECKDCRGCQPTHTDEVAEPGWQLCS